MGKILHLLGHAGIIALTFAATYYQFVPGKYAPLAVAVGGAAQAALALLNHKVAGK